MGSERRRPTENRAASKVTAGDTPRVRPKRLAVRDEHLLIHASCLDCDWVRRQRDQTRDEASQVRRLAGQHAVRRNHRVTWVRVEGSELRPRRWPS